MVYKFSLLKQVAEIKFSITSYRRDIARMLLYLIFVFLFIFIRNLVLLVATENWIINLCFWRSFTLNRFIFVMVVPVKERLLEKNNILLSLIFYDILFRKVREVTYIVAQRFEYCLISKGKNLLLYFLNKTLKGIRVIIHYFSLKMGHVIQFPIS